MKLRQVVFWSHLVAGVLAGLVILMMSVTGVLLTYERQIVDWVEQSFSAGPVNGRENLTADELVSVALLAAPDAQQVTLVYKNDPNAIMKVSAGRNNDFLVNPVSGEILHKGQTSTEAFFSKVMYIHRWFALSGDSRATGRAITGYSNLLFLFILVSGVYLWLPRVWKWAIIKTKIFLNPRAKSGKARDFNWHHVIAFWSVIPLFILVSTASVFYFPWASNLVYAAFGEDPPERRRGSASTEQLPTAEIHKSNAELLLLAKNELETRGLTDWETISMQAVTDTGAPASFRVDRSIGGQPAKVVNLKLDSIDGSVTSWRTFAESSPGSRARSNIRFLHTGEVFGFAGQTIAGLASLAACFLVWTGLALAWRRLIQSLFRNRHVRTTLADAT